MLPPEVVIARTSVLLYAAFLLCSCSSPDGPAPESATAPESAWKTQVREGSQKVASATAHGAVVVRDSVDTAYRGVKNGYAEPEDRAYGPYPRDYPRVIKKHMQRFEGLDDAASLRFGKPERAYFNKGLLRGGEVDWQGWVVDLEVEAKALFGEPRVVQYVVRMKDGEVVEVIERAHAGALSRVSDVRRPAPAAPAP